MSTLTALTTELSHELSRLGAQLDGSLKTDDLMRKLYATDASEYQEFPLAVAFPKSEADVRALILFAGKHKVGLIPRTAGTSLAGQVVGGGIVVDMGKYMNRLVKIDPENRRVLVQPGVVRNALNRALLPHGMLFGPETSTANRAMIGGMVGNNSCGSNSIVYGSTREHLVSARGFLSDGSEVVFKALTAREFHEKCEGDPQSLETRIYRHCRNVFSNPENRRLIREHFPKASIPRRNHGYAIDILMDAGVFDPDSEKPFNLCKLMAGSEGTLFLGVEFELDCSPLPPPESALICAHFENVDQALKAVLCTLPYSPFAVELIDHHILEATKRSIEHSKNRFFVEGNPGAILAIEIRGEEESTVQKNIESLIQDLKKQGLGYHYPILHGEDQARVWELRRAGQGLMNNIPGDLKPRENVEDTAVDVRDLPAYIAEFDGLMRNKHGIDCVYYAHAGTGELHTRPLFNLKTEEGLKLFRAVAEDIAKLVKKYQGSLSGEHGDGRLRGEFIPFMVGEECYEIMKGIKALFDPQNIFNPGKIIDTPPMDTSLRYNPQQGTPEYNTFFDFSANHGILRAAEQCNGSGDCLKGPLAGGAMCPSYMATRDERNSTRGRANILRHALQNPQKVLTPFDNEEIKQVMDLCLSCKACKAECPSNVDITKLKAEFLQHYYDSNGIPLRTRLIGHFAEFNKMASHFPWAWNFVFKRKSLRKIANRMIGFHPERSIPLLHKTTLSRWHKKRVRRQVAHQKRDEHRRKVYLFCDEFTEYNDVPIGQKTILLLEALGYEVIIPDHIESGRSKLSKGLLRKAIKIAEENVRRLAPVVTKEIPLVGIEPSAILSFRDEYPELVQEGLRKEAYALKENVLMIEEFLLREFREGRIKADSFISEAREIQVQPHCYQRALTTVTPILKALEIPENYKAVPIPAGCCGMAGSFGYEKEHFEVSQNVGELILLPTVRKFRDDIIIASSGTSCRHQIHDGTEREAEHPAAILYDALKEELKITA